MTASLLLSNICILFLLLSVAQKISLLSKSYRIFGDISVLRKCFSSFILPCLEYCSPALSSSAPSHLKLLDRAIRACTFLILNPEIDLWHRHSVSSLSMLYKILPNPNHPLNSELPDPLQPVRVTRHVLSVNSQAFTVGRCNTSISVF